MRLVLPALLVLAMATRIAHANCQDQAQTAYPPSQQAAPAAPSPWKLALDATIVSTVSGEALKRTFKDPRPVGSGYAFPSGHATLAFALARVTSSYYPKQKALWYLLAARVAWSRVKAGAHDWDDVIGGAALGCWVGDAEVAGGGIVLKKWDW